MRLVSFALAIALLALPALADDDAARLREGVESYSRGLDTVERDARLAHFRRAAALFESALASGRGTADLHVNLANAALQSERLGTAVLHLRRALVLDPDHARALQNLDYVRTLLPAWVPRREPAGLLDTFFFWHRTLSRSQRALVAGLAFLLTAAGIALSLRLDSPTPRNAAWIPAAIWLAMLGSLLAEPAAPERDDAVITAERLVARSADSPLAPPLLPDALPAGTEVRIAEARQPWLRVRLANGRDVWVPESGVTRVESGW